MTYLQFLGAAGTVTGSKHLVNTRDDSSHQPGVQVLVDCGLFQGQKEWRLRNWEDTPIPARQIDAVILTHAREPAVFGYHLGAFFKGCSTIHYLGHLFRLRTQGFYTFLSFYCIPYGVEQAFRPAVRAAINSGFSR